MHYVYPFFPNGPEKGGDWLARHQGELPDSVSIHGDASTWNHIQGTRTWVALQVPAGLVSQVLPVIRSEFDDPDTADRFITLCATTDEADALLDDMSLGAFLGLN